MAEERIVRRELLKRLGDLEGEIAGQRVEVARLEAEVARLEAENGELRRRLGMNSKNSHMPPSSDGYRKKGVQPAMLGGKSNVRQGVKKDIKARHCVRLRSPIG